MIYKGREIKVKGKREREKRKDICRERTWREWKEERGNEETNILILGISLPRTPIFISTKKMNVEIW